MCNEESCKSDSAASSSDICKQINGYEYPTSSMDHRKYNDIIDKAVSSEMSFESHGCRWVAGIVLPPTALWLGEQLVTTNKKSIFNQPDQFTSRVLNMPPSD